MKLLPIVAIFALMAPPNAAFAQRLGDVSYAEATLEVSQDPTKVVLQIRIDGGLSAHSRTMTVYGDGLVEMQSRQKNLIKESSSIEIGRDGVRDLVGTAIHHGVAEWHSETILAWMQQKHSSVLDVADGSRVRVALHLETYRRGQYEKTPHSKSFTVKTPGMAARFYPEIQQFQGVTRLVEWMNGHWPQAQ